MNISSPAFKNNESIPVKFTCDGENISPALSFSEVPPDAKSLALIMEDPDVPKSLLPSGLFVHWVAYDMPSDTKGIPEGAEAPGTPGQNGRGKAAYGGPCPPDREHRYFFKLYALDTKLNQAIATRGDLLSAMEGHVIASAELVGRFDRKR